uniref:Baseplate wedge protein n=1 Tax=Siphoviridae sp. ctrpg19 TaxID=2826481 RepID=A0A8S5MKA7_9CAUD|nr:MAG TPA: Baseplate wedge protein [Siphoviridae sp. ctrpg19]
MYTEQELQISNKSYTNKDFQTIYPELLDLVPKLTDKWAPMNSNESDPGVVLLKLGALLADKNNYNIDKNILETFPLSVTQQSNARKLYDMLGYSMSWYKAS